MNNDTPTPLTDAQAHWHIYEDGFHTVSKCAPKNGNWAPIAFARDLERKLARAMDDVSAMHDGINRSLITRANLMKELEANKQDAERLAAVLKAIYNNGQGGEVFPCLTGEFKDTSWAERFRMVEKALREHEQLNV